MGLPPGAKPDTYQKILPPMGVVERRGHCPLGSVPSWKRGARVYAFVKGRGGDLRPGVPGYKGSVRKKEQESTHIGGLGNSGNATESMVNEKENEIGAAEGERYTFFSYKDNFIRTIRLRFD